MKKIISLALAFVMLMSVVSCTKAVKEFTEADEYKTVTLDGLNLDVRSDMTYDNTIKDSSGENIEAYVCDFYGITVTSFPVGILKFSGYKDAEAILNLAAQESTDIQMDIKKSGAYVYGEYNENIDGVEYNNIAYIIELGYHYYIVEFFNNTLEQEKYRSEYEKILDSAEPAVTPEETKDISIEGVKITVGGDVEFDENSDVYCGSDYCIFAMVNVTDISAKDFCQSVLNAYELQTADGESVTEIGNEGDIYFFDYFENELYFYNYYIGNIDGHLVNIIFSTMDEANDDLKAEFIKIVQSAVLE